ncbi:hypothetical protein QQA45_07115, partial [Sneathia sanguinegens]
SFILAPSRVNLYVVFLVSVVLSGVTVIPEFSSLVTSTESFAIFCTSDFFTANLYSFVCPFVSVPPDISTILSSPSALETLIRFFITFLPSSLILSNFTFAFSLFNPVISFVFWVILLCNAVCILST